MHLEPDDSLPSHDGPSLASRPSFSGKFSIAGAADYAAHWSPMPSDAWLRGLPLAVLTVSLIAVPVLVLQPQGMPRMRALDKELQTVDAENAELRRDVARLRAEVKDLRENPTAVERIAREQLGLVRKSEVVFQFEKK